MERDLEQRIRGPTSFNNLMNKIKISQSRTLKRTKRMKVGRKENKLILAAEWIDNQAILYIKERKIEAGYGGMRGKREHPKKYKKP